MPITVNHALTATTPDNPGYEIRPSHWNDTHNISLSLAANEVIKFVSAGLNSVSSGTIQFANSNGVSFGMDANGVITATVVPGAAAGIAAASAGTQIQTSGMLQFVNSNGVTFGMYNSSQVTMDFGSSSLAGIGFTSTTTAGTEVKATLSTNGLSMAMPALLTTAALSNHSHGNPQLNLTNLTGTTASNSAGLTLSLSGNAAQTNQSAIRGFGVSNTGATAGNTGISTGIDWVMAGSQSLTLSQSTAAGGPNTVWFQHPAWLTTAARSQDSSNYAGLGTTFNGANISGSMTMSTNGLQLSMSVAAPGAGGGIQIAAGTRTATTANTLLFDNANGITFGLNAAGGSVMTASHNAITSQSNQQMTMFATGNTTQSSTGTNDASSLIFRGEGIASVGITGGSVVISVPSGGGAGDGYNIVSMLTSTSGGGTAGATFSALSASVGLMAGSNITLSQTSNTINIIAPNSSSIVGASGISFSTNGSTITAYNAPRSSMVLPQMALSVLGAMGNGSFSIAYRDVMAPVSVTRVDVPFHWVQATTANANTIGIAMTVLCGIYTRNASTLNTVSSASTQTTYTYASNSAGNTQLTAAAYRPVSLPMNINMSGGQYYVGFGISTAATSIGTATTTAAQTISVVGAPQGSSAVPWTDEFTRVTATSVGMFSGHGIYSAAVSSVVPAISLSAINQSGSYFHRANFALVMRG